MRVIPLEAAGYAANSYLIADDGSKTFAVVDPSTEPSAAQDLLAAGYKLKYVLLTHGHFDHILFFMNKSIIFLINFPNFSGLFVLGFIIIPFIYSEIYSISS